MHILALILPFCQVNSNKLYQLSYMYVSFCNNLCYTDNRLKQIFTYLGSYQQHSAQSGKSLLPYRQLTNDHSSSILWADNANQRENTQSMSCQSKHFYSAQGFLVRGYVKGC